MRKLRLHTLLFLLAISLFNTPAQAHLGPHESKDCFIDIEELRLRFNGYQFQSQHPDKHYCRYFPELGDVIIKIDALQELDNQEIALEWLEMGDLTRLLSSDPLFLRSKDSGWRNFSGQLQSLRNNVTQRGVYGIKIRLKDENGVILQRHHYFLVGFPVMYILLSIAGLLLLLISYFFIKQLRHK